MRYIFFLFLEENICCEALLMSTCNMFSSCSKKNVNFPAIKSWLDNWILIIYLSMDKYLILIIPQPCSYEYPQYSFLWRNEKKHQYILNEKKNMCTFLDKRCLIWSFDNTCLHVFC